MVGGAVSDDARALNLVTIAVRKSHMNLAKTGRTVRLSFSVKLGLKADLTIHILREGGPFRGRIARPPHLV